MGVKNMYWFKPDSHERLKNHHKFSDWVSGYEMFGYATNSYHQFATTCMESHAIESFKQLNNEMRYKILEELLLEGMYGYVSV